MANTGGLLAMHRNFRQSELGFPVTAFRIASKWRVCAFAPGATVAGKLWSVRFSWSNFFAGVGRAMALLGIALWVGGMAFFGAVAAPLMFRAARASAAPELAPILVGQMLGRFTYVTYVCAGLLLVGWIVDGYFARDRRLGWWLQGALSALCLAFALYLGGAVLPRTVAQQAQIVPLFVKDARGQTLTPAEQRARAQFDVGHQEYQKLGALNVYLLLALLLIIVARTRVWATPLGNARAIA